MIRTNHLMFLVGLELIDHLLKCTWIQVFDSMAPWQPLQTTNFGHLY